VSAGADYRVQLTPAAERQLRRLPPGDAARLRAPILGLGIEPRPASVTNLVGTDYFLRLRVGQLRVIYLVDDDAHLVVILRVARRAESTHRRMG
jgi:mRNA interferase RelE/StbE